MRLDLHWEIQQPITIWGGAAKAYFCCFTVVRDICVLSSSVQCSVVTFYQLAKGNERSEKRCKVKMATLV
jgi:hypothetical protein